MFLVVEGKKWCDVLNQHFRAKPVIITPSLYSCTCIKFVKQINISEPSNGWSLSTTKQERKKVSGKSRHTVFNFYYNPLRFQ